MQIHDLDLEKFSTKNARRFGNSISEYIETNREVENLSKSYLRLKVVVNVEEPLMDDFWWKNLQGIEIWANIKYERLYDICYGCRKLSHTTQSRKDEVQMS